jgi:hypothetical protein
MQITSERCSPSLVTREMQIKTMTLSHLPIWLKLKRIKVLNVGWNMEHFGSLTCPCRTNTWETLNI